MTEQEFREAYDLAKSDARKSFLSFIAWTFPDFEVNWHHRVLAREIKKFISRETQNLMVFMPPRVGKTEFISRRMPAFIQGQNPDAKIIGTSYGAELASMNNRDVQRIIDSDSYREIFPNTTLSGENVRSDINGTWLRNNDVYEVVGHKGTYRSSGVGGTLTGTGGNYLIIDDPVKNADEADSITYRDRVHEWYKTTLYSRREKGAGVCLVMTRWHEDDLAARLLAENPTDWKVVSFPMIAEEDEKYRKAGEPLWPAKYNLEECMRIKRSVGSRAWAALYQQRPAPIEGNIVNAKWFRHYSALPKDYLRKIISVDATFKKTDTGSYVCMQAWGKNNANHYLIDQVRKRMDFPETIKTLRDFCSKHYGYEAVVIEDKANGPAIIDTIRQVIPAVVSCSPYGSKESRLSSVSPMIEAGNVHLPLISENPWVEDFLTEASTFPAGKYNDQVDTMSQALNWYRENESSIDHLIML